MLRSAPPGAAPDAASVPSVSENSPDPPGFFSGHSFICYPRTCLVAWLQPLLWWGHKLVSKKASFPSYLRGIPLPGNAPGEQRKPCREPGTMTTAWRQWADTDTDLSRNHLKPPMNPLYYQHLCGMCDTPSLWHAMVTFWGSFPTAFWSKSMHNADFWQVRYKQMSITKHQIQNFTKLPKH